MASVVKIVVIERKTDGQRNTGVRVVESKSRQRQNFDSILILLSSDKRYPKSYKI